MSAVFAYKNGIDTSSSGPYPRHKLNVSLIETKAKMFLLQLGTVGLFLTPLVIGADITRTYPNWHRPHHSIRL